MIRDSLIAIYHCFSSSQKKEVQMKLVSRFILLTTLIFLSFNSHAIEIGKDQLLLEALYTGDSFIINNKDIADLITWDGKGEAPLGLESAIKLASKKHKSEFDSVHFRSIRLKSKKTKCDKSLSCPKKLFFYAVKTRGDNFKTYIILMDGSFIKSVK